MPAKDKQVLQDSRSEDLRCRGEEALRESEERYREVFEKNSDATMIFDAETHRFEDANGATLSLYGYTREEFLALTVEDISAEPDQTRALISRHVTGEAGPRIPLRYHQKKKDGSVFPVEISTGVYFAGGRRKIIGTVTDITARKKAEAALRESEERFRIAAETSNDLIYEWDLKQNLQWPDKIDEMLGYGPGEFSRTLDGWAESVHPEDIDHVKASIEAHLEGRVPYVEEYRIRRKDGVYLWWSARGDTSMSSPDGTPVRWIGTVTDITARKKAEAALRESEEKYRLLVDNAADAVVVAQDGYIKFINPAATRILGLSEVVLTSTPFMEFIHPDDRDMVMDNHRKRIKGEAMASFYPFRIVDLHGHVRWVELNVVLIDWDGRPATLNLLTNISERKQAEETLRLEKEISDKILGNIPVMIAFLDVQGKHQWVNQCWQKILGWSMEEALNRDILADLYPNPEYRGYVIDSIAKATGSWGDFKTRSRGGVVLDTSWTNVPLADGSNIGIGIDITERKQEEEKLRETNELFSLFVRHSPVYCYIKDVNSTRSLVLEASDNFQQMIGIPGRKMIGMTMEDLYAPEFAAKITADDWMVVSKGDVLRLDEELNGRSYATIKFPIIQGDKTLLAGYTIDITERKRAEEALRESEERYRVLFEGSTHGILAVDVEKGRFAYANPTICRMLGYSEIELLQLTVMDIHPKDSLDQVMVEFESQNRGEKTMSSALPCLRKDGTVFYADIASSLSIVQGRRYNVGFFMDVSERRQVAEALRESEQRFQLMAEAIQDVFWIATPGIGKTLYVSPGYESVWGRTCQELYQSPQSFIDAIHPEDREQARSEIAAKETQGVAYSHEYRIIKPDGAVRWIQDRGFPVRDDQGRIILITGVATDVTERKSMEAQFLQAQKMEAVGRLAGGVAHDFNNILSVIFGYGDLMNQALRPKNPLAGYLAKIREATDRAAVLTSQLLAFSRKTILAPQILNLNDQLAGIEPMLGRLIGEDIEIIMVLDPALEPVKADPGQLDQIVMNLAINARDAMPSGGNLTLETANVYLDEDYAREHTYVTPGHYVMLAVTDNGQGMDAETQAHVFEPFFTTKELGRGTGLGLSTAYGIVKQSGGHIGVYSEVGQGTTFKVYLPLVQEAVAAVSEAKPIARDLHGSETILVVEDEDMLREIIGRSLKIYGYTVLEARHGGEALLLCERHPEPIHLMLTDVVMPNMNGRELADRLVPLRPDMKVLYMSGYTDNAIVHHGVLEADIFFVQKPFRTKNLIEKIREILGESLPKP